MAVVKRKDAVVSPLFEVVAGGYRYVRPEWMDETPGMKWGPEIEQYTRKVAHKWARESGLSEADREDFVNGVVLEAWRNIDQGRFRSKSAIGSLVKSRLIDQARRRKVRGECQPLDGMEEGIVDQQARSGFEDAMARMDFDAESLPPGLRLYAMLQYQGHDDAECAAEMGFESVSALREQVRAWRLTHRYGQGTIGDGAL